ncbi:MAG: ATP-binding protein [Nocardiopsaceae bacterium]|jgi:anti-sigma regulatory factor (Ser/Thr protein kinase)|nr:ATP-binding protein [Nocardiopsaceae bacterium]
MSTLAQARQDVERPLRLSLHAHPSAAAEARGYVQAAIRAWGVPVDPYVAALLTSELVTNAIRHETGEKVKLFVSCSCGHLRVYVHDSSRTWPVPLNAPIDAEAGRGLTLVASLSTDWGVYRTPSGKAVYFTLALQDDLSDDDAEASPGRVDVRDFL